MSKHRADVPVLTEPYGKRADVGRHRAPEAGDGRHRRPYDRVIELVCLDDTYVGQHRRSPEEIAAMRRHPSGRRGTDLSAFTLRLV